MFSEVEILKAKKAGDIFSNNSTKVKNEFRELAKVYHPDINKSPAANTVFIKLNELYNKALDLIEKNEWESSNTLFLTHSANKRQYKINFLSEKSFELGKFYICKNTIIYILDNGHEKYYNNFLRQVAKIKYDSPRMKDDFSRYLPQIDMHFIDTLGRYCIFLKKTEDVYLLSDISDYYKGFMPAVHVAWVMSRLLNLCCYLQHIGIVHNGISLNNCFISPKYHSIMLLGGWWYATDYKAPMIGTQKEIFELMTVKDKGTKTSNYITDLESSKFIGRKLLNSSIKSLVDFRKTGTPKPFINYIFNGSEPNAINEFIQWSNVLTDSFGPRKFIEMKISDNDIYAQ